jgi:hypothetical protein
MRPACYMLRVATATGYTGQGGREGCLCIIRRLPGCHDAMTMTSRISVPRPLHHHHLHVTQVPRGRHRSYVSRELKLRV